MRKMTEQEFKQDTLEMLKVFAKFCEEHNLKYILDYGTLLGAVRHKGFIPWDDDIDVSMPRADYEKLYQLLAKRDFAFNERYKLASTRNKYNIYKGYFNVVDITTITESKVRKKKYNYPVWLDIFPCDEVDAENFDDRMVRKWDGLARKPIFRPKGNLLKDIMKGALIVSSQECFRLADKTCQRLNGKGFAQLHNYYTPYGAKDMTCLEYFDDYTYGEFEGEKFRIPRSYDTRLSGLYGNYMELPPVEKRVAHVNEAYYLEETHDE